jgi:DNA replication protein DnaC
LDDLGTQNATPWAQEKLFQIINHRYVNRLPTVVTTNVDLQSIDGRISSRLKDDTLVQKVRITAPDYPPAHNRFNPSAAVIAAFARQAHAGHF